MTKSSFASAVLRGLGIAPSYGAMRAMVGWMNAEGGHWNNDARYNPLNTTQNEPGAGNTGTQGNIKVYKDWQQGISATVATLKNGRYGNIISALKIGNPNAVAHAIGASPWGTNGGLVTRTIASTPSSLPDTSIGSSTSPSSGASRTRTMPGQSFAQERAAAASDFLSSGRNDSQNNLDFAMQIRGLQDVPSRTMTVGNPRSSVSSTSLGQSPGADIYTQRANAIDAQRLPYKWGGGHQRQTGLHDAVPLDCSGAVSKVLGIDPRVSGQFQSWGRPGDGGNKGVTVASNSHHVLMKIDGHWWGTSRSNPGGGAGWIPQSQITPAYLKGFTLRHSER